MTDFLFEGSKITVDGDCSPEVKRGSLLGRKAMTNLGSAFKNRDITLLTKVCLVKAMVLPEVMYGCACWTIKVEHWWTDAFELWCWRRLLRVPWTPRKSNQSILKDWCWSSNTLAIWCKEPTHWKRPWCWERPRTKGEEGGRGWHGQTASLTQWAIQEIVKDRGAWHAAAHGVATSQRLETEHHHPSNAPSPGSSAICFLSPWVSLSWTFHIKRIKICVLSLPQFCITF